MKAQAFRAEPQPDPLLRALVDVATAIAERKRAERQQVTPSESEAFLRRLGRWLAIVSLGRGPKA